MKIKRGGFRPGSGRKPKYQYEAREILNMAIDERMPKIFEKLDDLIEKGDPTILKMLIEQRYGRPTVPETPKISQKQQINQFFFDPAIRAKVLEVESELKKKLYGKPLVDDDGTVVPWEDII